MFEKEIGKEIIGHEVRKIIEILSDSGKRHINKPHFDFVYHTKLTIDKTTIQADGMDIATITAKLFIYLDEAQTAWEGDIIFELDGVQQTIPTTNGEASVTFNTTVAGEYAIKTVIPNFRNGEVKVMAQ